MFFTIIIPLYNSNYINIQIKSIYSLILDNIKLEIIFIDDWSDEKYKILYEKNIYFLKELKKINIKYIDLWPKYWKNRVCLARNIWARKAIWENIIFIDQDTILHKNYIKYLIDYLKNNNNSNILIWPYYWYNNFQKNISKEDIDFYIENWYISKNNFKDFRIDFYKEKQENNRIWEFFWASNFFIKKEIYENSLGFDDNITTWWDEDVEFWYRLYKSWYKIIFDENFWVLNLSKKLYSFPYKILEENKIESLSENWLKNYEKHKNYEYKRYIFDRFNNLELNLKIKISPNLKNNFLNKKNILIHAINWIWLGHIKRTVLIAKELIKLDEIWEIIFVSNSSNPFLIESEWFKVEKLEYWIEDTLKDISFDTYENKNFKKINKIINENNIDIIIYDTYFIKNLVLNRKDLKHFLILRDSEIDYLNSIKDYLPNFRKIFIPHIKEEFSKEKQDFLNYFKNILFSWYVVEKFEKIENKNKKIIVSPGYWGDYENTKSFFKYVNNLLTLNKNIINWYEIEFILWKHYKKLKKEIDFNLDFKLFDFNYNLSEEIKKCSLFIWRGWYNTLNEVVLNNTKSLIFSVDRFAENQENRIDFFINKFNLSFLKKWTYNFEIDLINLEKLFLNNILSNRLNLTIFSWIKNIVDEIKEELNKENILVFKHIFLPKSENFIFEELKWFIKINPIIFTFKKENKELFSNSFEIIYNSIFNELLNLEYPKIKNKELYIKFLKYIISIIKKNNIKIIYTEFLFDAYFIYKIKSIYKNIKIYSAWRWFDVYSFLENHHINKVDFFSNIDEIFVRDKNMKSKILSYWYNKIEIIRSVLNLEKYEFKNQNFNKLKILIWGRFTEKKNLFELLELIKNLYDKRIISEIWIVWDWELESKIILKINELNLKNIIKIYWFQEHNNLIKTIKEYNCFINYSKKASNWDDEWIPNLIVENMLCWNLVFSSITGWIWELFNNDNYSYLTWNIYKDCDKIIKIFQNKILVKEIIKENYEKVRNMYKRENSILKLEKILK